MPVDTFEGAHLDAELTNPAIHIVAHLAKNPLDPDADSIALVDLVECDFPGYASITLEEAAIDVFDDETYAEAFFNDVTWLAEDVVTPQAVYACYVTITTDGVGTVLNNLHIFKAPLVIDKAGAKITLNFSVMATSAGES